MYRRKFTKGFKEAAVKKIIRGTPVERVARACRVDPAILRRWQKESEEFGAKAFGGYGKSRRARAAPNRRKFTKEFKEAAVRKLRLGTPVEKVARARRVNRWILRRWQEEYEEFGARAFGGYGKSRQTCAEPRSRAITLYLSSDELAAVKAASSATGFQNLAEFTRSCVFRETRERPLAEVEKIFEELAVLMRRLTQRLLRSR